MKSLIFALAILVAPLASNACPGGNLKTFVLNGKDVAQLDFAQNVVTVLDGSLSLDRVYLESSNGSSFICDQPSDTVDCTNSQKLGFDLRNDSDSVLGVVLVNKDGNVIGFEASGFIQTRSMTCGEKIQPIVDYR